MFLAYTTHKDVDTDVFWMVVITYIITISKQSTGSEICIHDSLQVSSIPTQWIGYDDSSKRMRRDINADLYSPVRISPFYSDLEVELVQKDVTKLKLYVDEAIQYTSSILSVIPVQGPLLLKRTTGCLKYWVKGQNIGKCSTLDRQYKGEFCHESLKIPDEHLDSLNVWNRTSPEPVRRFYNRGRGVVTDYILYVRSLSSQNCLSNQNRLLAYATYCRLDQNNRPVAGVINICPDAVRSEDIKTEKIYQTVIHELFHALGFSKSLFTKFRDCSNSDSGSNCSQQSYDSLFKEVNGVQRLATPMVIQKMKEHFNCSEEDYGGPIKFQNGKATSHWEEKFMYGSIMTAKLGQPHLTVVDPITLAVLEDSGWYKVDYTKADRFLWGKGEGCMFGLPDTCQNDSQYFCTDQTVTGCHYLHKDKAVCDVTDIGDKCKVLQPKPQGECFQRQKGETNNDVTEIFTKSSRCFWSNLTTMEHPGGGELEGRCYNHRCLPGQILQVQLRNSSWVHCPYGEYINIPEYQGVIKCPDNKDILCPLKPTVTTSTPAITSTKITGVPVKIYIIFKKKVLNEDKITKEDFHKLIRQKILNITMVDSNRLQNVMIDSREGVVMFDLITLGDPEKDQTYQSLYKSVVSGNFVLNLGLDSDTTVIPVDIRIEDKTTTDAVINDSASSCWYSAYQILYILIVVDILSCNLLYNLVTSLL